MRINYNVSAAIANKHLLGIEDNLSTTMERLSSGLKINHSKDNPAGMAISSKMNAQIKGLDRASDNASDGISVIQIADGALSETTDIIQRMRELAVQGASDATMTPADREAIQKEISSLKEEVDRISRDTEYNSKTLLDGSLDTRVYTQHATRVDISDHVKAGQYELVIEKAATQPDSVTANKDFNSTTAQIGATGKLNINGCEVEISATDTMADVYEKIRDAAETGETKVERDGTNGNLTFTATGYGKGTELRMTVDNQNLANSLGIAASGVYSWVEDTASGKFVYGVQKTDADGNLVTDSDGNPIIVGPTGRDADVEFPNPKVGFTDTATVTYDGNKITVTDLGGFSLSFLAEEGYDATTIPGTPPVVRDGKIKFDVTDIGTMTLHIGANMDQNMEVRIQEVSCKSLYIDDITVTTVSGASRALTQLDDALAKVSDVRAKLGAYENRLEHSVESLDAFEENMTGAMSRLSDADMAEEMTEYTHQNVLNQAAISVLTQANDLPQQVLQILQ